MDNSINHSFGVIVYKDSPYLEACLESLKKQTVKSRIYITTSTPSAYIHDIARAHGLEVYATDGGQGIAHDWNFCLEKAETRYVTLAHQDDVYLPRYTEMCLRKAERNQDMLICFTGYAEIKNGDIRKNTLLLNIKSLILNFFMPLGISVKNKFLKRKLISFGSPIPAPSVMYDLEPLKEFRFSGEFRVNLDWDAWYRMSLMKGRFLRVRKTLVHHRIHDDSETSLGIATQVRKREDKIMFRRLWPNLIADFLSGKYEKGYQSNS